MSLDKADIEKLAELARVRVADEELPEVTERIASILELVDQMRAVDTSGVEPLAHPLDARQRLRQDRVTEDDRRGDFQALAPAVEDGLYLVPRVVE
jgi:aspartyl-tRNA(Asn)/glutamyl-tRNA(Gln) amidotransferase subunit C